MTKHSENTKTSNSTKPVLSVVFDFLKNIFKKKKKEEKHFVQYKEIPFIIYARRSGNTTRLIDSFVQDFFIKGKCKTHDHYCTTESNRRVFELVLLRLKNEHEIREEDVKLDRTRLTITNLNYR
jgi:hypothetical protein